MIVQTSKIRLIILAILPIILLSGMVYYIMSATFIDRGSSLPELAVEKVEFKRDPSMIIVYVRNIGQDVVIITQADINDNPTTATATPNILNRLDSSKVIIYYPWIENIPYEIGITVSDGTRFAFNIDAAVLSPEADNDQLIYFAIIGSYVGIIPVVLGFLWLPFMRKIEQRWYLFFLSLTTGLLAFLAIDAIIESFELVNKFTIINGEILIPIITISSSLLLMLIKTDTKTRSVLYLACIIAVGIGLHNLGEGLAIGAATSIGAIALSRFLIIGFTIHNTTEGLAIVAPMTRSKVKIAHLAILGLIAGAPTIIGAWIGSFINFPIASIIFLSIGAGAIFQVIYVIFAWLKEKYDILSIRSISGFVMGMLIMYITSILVA